MGRCTKHWATAFLGRSEALCEGRLSRRRRTASRTASRTVRGQSAPGLSRRCRPRLSGPPTGRGVAPTCSANAGGRSSRGPSGALRQGDGRNPGSTCEHLATLRSIWGQRWKLPSSEGGDHPREVHSTLRHSQAPLSLGLLRRASGGRRPTRRGRSCREGASPCRARETRRAVS